MAVRVAAMPCSVAQRLSTTAAAAAGMHHCLGAERCGQHISYRVCVCPAVQRKVTCGGLSITGAASAVSSSSHVARPPQPSRDVRRDMF